MAKTAKQHPSWGARLWWQIGASVETEVIWSADTMLPDRPYWLDLPPEAWEQLWAIRERLA